MTSSVYSNTEAGLQHGVELLTAHRKRLAEARERFGAPAAQMMSEMANIAVLCKGVVAGILGPDVVARESPEIITRMFAALLDLVPTADSVQLAQTFTEFCEGLASYNPPDIKES